MTGSAAAVNPKYAGFVIDANNGHVLYADRADELRFPASLTKMMTLYLTFEAMKSGRISKNDAMPVSSYAASRPPSKLGLKPGSTLKVEEAIYSLVTKSANDAAVVLAEYQAGSEAAFARRMTERARQLGMAHTVFKNANGLPNSDQHTTARDLSKLGIALREHFPEYYGYFSTRSYSFRGRRLGNHNRVLFRVDGADGIKTGYINASGFNLVTSVKRDGKSVVAVVMGGTSGRSRDDHMVELLRRYLPEASTKDTGPLIASRDTMRVASLPEEVPVPGSRPVGGMSINDRIAEAYGTETATRIAAIPEPSNRPILGRDAIRAALVEERPVGAANAILPLVRPAAARPVPTPAAAIPQDRGLDTSRTGSIASDQTPNSPWVVQIAATDDKGRAISMLTEAKQKVGRPLAKAEPFTETVRSGSQVLHRARFAGFSSKDQAWNACTALKRADYSCYAVAN
ncbi:D-alanyl-D-alanine carboxypeptidase [Aurantimonas sp. VKM B-3413]|uniref:D-alanyl-D-alanine carboxypeptidase n=1 Tax=Aurantimonas sp. VKM B-3413 TaxID=2779401 RepID=UPI001E2AC055|nr:D-alanyl-D-alanine carboxypeptidase [Aurantimonas sp. VKM B-3413]MCB8840440.1 D-alanyl-D-alanine carboxypeptidase [Aurantimonas sp. VKM B-3413]